MSDMDKRNSLDHGKQGACKPCQKPIEPAVGCSGCFLGVVIQGLEHLLPAVMQPVVEVMARGHATTSSAGGRFNAGLDCAMLGDGCVRHSGTRQLHPHASSAQVGLPGPARPTQTLALRPRYPNTRGAKHGLHPRVNSCKAQAARQQPPLVCVMPLHCFLISHAQPASMGPHLSQSTYMSYVCDHVNVFFLGTYIINPL